jgi:hypothetical protein
MDSQGPTSASAVATDATGSLRRRVQYGALGIVAVVTVLMNTVMPPAELVVLPVTGWVESIGVHQVHDMVLFALLWTAVIAAMLLQLYRPARRVSTVLAPAFVAIPLALMAFPVDSEVLMPSVTTAVLGLLAIAVHPAGRDLLRFQRTDGVDRRLLGLFALGAVPLLGYGALELSKQLTIGPANEHTFLVHYGAMAVVSTYVAVFGALALFRDRDWRFPAWSVGVVAAYLGLSSVAYPDVASSLGQLAGALLFVWAVAFLGGVEFTRRGRTGPGTERADEPTTA